MKNVFAGVFIAAFCFAGSVTAEDKLEEGFVRLFDGKTFTGWKASENKDSWKIEDGAFVCFGPRSHLFYEGELAPFKNFEFKADVMTTPGSNAGIYFHTRYQETGWPKYGFEAQVNNSHGDPRKTGSLYAVKDVMNIPPAKDNVWFTEEIIVRGKHIVIKVDGKTVVDYTEPADKKAGEDFTRVVDQGTFAFQAHDPQSKVYFKNIRVKKLPDDAQ
jgi:hypothetical protein